MNNISFIQQEEFEYISLQLRLGMMTQLEADEFESYKRLIPLKFVPLKYTARLRAMEGDFVVIRGIGHNYERVEPVIELRLEIKYIIPMKTGRIHGWEQGCLSNVDIDENAIAEQCMGIKNTTFDQFKRKLMNMNKNATLDSVFYVHEINKICKMV